MTTLLPLTLEVTMSNLAVSPALAIDSHTWGNPLSQDELDSTVGGADPLSWAVLAFGVSVAIGVLDRIFFGGCRCR